MPQNKKPKYVAILIVMMTLGASWAIRGRFGHEYGAAWAGSIGILALLLASNRKDWLQNWLPIAAAGAVGWGMTGMISYGAVVGYGKSGDLLNTSYGLLSLFVIGGLFGFLGGGFTGLMLESGNKKKPEWAPLLTQMVAGGIVFWGFLIYQLEWFMTPPRSELWAACLGAAFAMGWYMLRHRFKNAWYVAMLTMLGAGFGFAFGNFMQATGINAGIGINWWNVMEYSIGSFGGLGLAYGVYSRSWPEMPRCSAASMKWSALLLFVLIPLWTITNAFEWGKITRWAERSGVDMVDQYATGVYVQMGIVSFLALIGLFVLARKTFHQRATRRLVFMATLVTCFWYQALKLITSGLFGYYTVSMEELTVLNLLAVAILIYAQNLEISPFEWPVADGEFNTLLRRTGLVVIVVILILSVIASGVIDDMPGSNYRFGGE